MTDVVRYNLEGEIGVITVDNPPVNATSHAVREGIYQAVNAAQNDESRALVLICAGRTFIAGADISEFGKPPKDPILPDVMLALQSSNKPIVAALHGTALGGGFETALACHYRCALPSAKVGLPEVNLGLLPGAGGTQRLPRLIGADKALDMILSGKPVAAPKAADWGLIDHLVEGDDLLAGALAYAQSLVAQDAGPRRVDDMAVPAESATAELFEQQRAQQAKRKRGFIAPQKCIDAVEYATQLPITEGLKKERELFLELVNSTQAGAQRHLFFAEREVGKVPGLDKSTATREINRVAVVGGGTMGSGIVMAFVDAGIPVTMVEINDEALERGLSLVRKGYESSVKKGRITEAQRDDKLALVSGTTDYSTLGEIDLAIEAVFENMDVKKTVFKNLDAALKPGAILASNTSYLDLNAIAEATSRPADVIGMHFFSPANIMKLLEVVRGDATSDDVIATVMKLAKKIRKVGVLVGVCYGFVGNRMYTQYNREVQMLLLEGASPEQIDQALTQWGMAMGPLAVTDMAGIDIGYKARQENKANLPDDPKYFRIANALAEKGDLGQKTGKGFYVYDPETRAKSENPELPALIEAEAKALSVPQREISAEEIVERTIFALINEGAKILEEGIALRASDIDVVWANGYGFPRYRGGPMFYADTLGLDHVYKRVEEFRQQHGDLYWQPAQLLEQLAQAGKSFKQWDQEQTN